MNGNNLRDAHGNTAFCFSLGNLAILQAVEFQEALAVITANV